MRSARRASIAAGQLVVASAALIGPVLAAPGLVGLSLTDFDADHDSTEEHAQRIVEALGRARP